MNKNKNYKSDILAAVHETVSGYYAAGVIDEQTMRDFDESCLTPTHDLTAKEVLESLLAGITSENLYEEIDFGASIS